MIITTVYSSESKDSEHSAVACVIYVNLYTECIETNQFVLTFYSI